MHYLTKRHWIYFISVFIVLGIIFSHEDMRTFSAFSIGSVALIVILSIIAVIDFRRLHIMQMEYQLILDGSQGGVRKFTLGSEYKMEHISQGILRLMGYSHREVIRKINTIYSDAIYYEDRKLFNDTLEYLETNMDTRRIEYRIQQRNGSLIWVSDTITSSSDVKGKVSAYGIVSNINDLKLSDHYLNTLMDSIPGGIIIFEVSDNYKTVKVSFFNDMICNMMNFTRAEFEVMFSNDAREIIYKGDFELVRGKFRNVVEGAETEECIYRSRTKTGIMWTRATTKVISREQESIKIYAVVMNVEKQMQTELSLKKQRYYHELIDESLSAATLITAFDENRTLLYSSKNIVQLLGYTQEEFGNLYKKHYANLIHPIEYKRINNLKRLYAAREVVSYELEFRVKHKEGHYIWLGEKARLIEDDQGRRAHLIVAYDITENKKAQEELLIQEEEFRIASLQNNKIVYRYNIQENTIQASKDVIDRIGFTKYQENIPESIIQAGIIHEEGLEEFREFFQNIMEYEEMGSMECAIVTGDNTKCWYQFRFTSIQGMNTQPIHTIISAVDITEIKQIQKDYEKLLEQEKEVETNERLLQAFRYYPKSKGIDFRRAEKKRLGVEEHELLTIEQLKEFGIISDENQEVYEKIFDRIHAGEPSGELEYQIRYTTGEGHKEILKFKNVFDQEGNPEYAIVIIENV